MAAPQIDIFSYRSPNWSPRPVGVSPDMIVMHTGEGSKKSDLEALMDDKRPLAKRVSAHYYVDKTGKVYELVSPNREAWHAGTSSWQGRGSLAIRQHSIGIESEHRAGEAWPTVQKEAYAALMRYLIERYHIRKDMIAAHRWIAKGRKSDPTDWPDAELKPWIAALYAPLARLWRVTDPSGVNVRAEATAASPKIAPALPQGTLFHGSPVQGAAVGVNNVWVARLPSEGGGNMWSGALEEVK